MACKSKSAGGGAHTKHSPHAKATKGHKATKHKASSKHKAHHKAAKHTKQHAVVCGRAGGSQPVVGGG